MIISYRRQIKFALLSEFISNAISHGRKSNLVLPGTVGFNPKEDRPYSAISTFGLPEENGQRVPRHMVSYPITPHGKTRSSVHFQSNDSTFQSCIFFVRVG